MKLKYVIAAVLVATNPVYAGQVNETNVVNFQGGLPALAAEVNANFDELITQINDNDSRIGVLENSTSPSTGILDLVLDCDANPLALNDGIVDAPSGFTLSISVTGTCEPVTITRSNVNISGPATITSNAGGSDPLTVEGASNVVITGLTLDAQGLAESALNIIRDSSVAAFQISAQGGTGQAIDVIRSTLRLGADNLITGTGTPAMEVGGDALVLVESGTTDIVSDSDALLINNSAIVANVSPSILNISGTFMEINELSNLVLSNGTVNVGSIEVNRSSVLSVDVDGTDSVSLVGNILGTLNSVINFKGDENAQITTDGNLTLASGAVAQGLGTGAAIVQVGTGVGNALVLNANAQFGGIGLASLEFDTSTALHGSLIRLFFGGTAAVDSLFTITSNSILVSDNTTQPISQANVTCGFQGTPIAGFAYIGGSTFVDLCATPSP